MTDANKSSVLQYLRRLAAHQRDDDVPDEQLLERFVRQRDESAFAALLRRHGPMVLSVCRGIVKHIHDAEDAFQATFLIFSQKAASIRQRQSLGGWLYEVAYRVAVKASAGAARRRQVERRTPDRMQADPLDDLTVRELRQALHEELRRLPEKYRMPLVLCYLQGQSQEEAARQLGWPKRRLKDRLQRGKERLHRRLSQRGLAPASLLGAVVIAEGTVPAALVDAAMQSALHAAPLAPALACLVQAGGTMASVGKAKMATAILLTASLLSGAGAWLCRDWLAPAAVPLAEYRKQPRPSANSEKRETIAVRGRVLDPDGKPVEAARLYWPRMPKTPPHSEEDIEFTQLGKTDTEGRFRFDLPRADFLPEKKFPILAAAEGYGVDWAELPKPDAPADVTLRLVKDQPIEGRIISTEGKPLAGVRVRAMLVSKPSQGRLDDFLAAWKRDWQKTYGQNSSPPHSMLLPPDLKSSQAVTDKDGRFRVCGAGVERIVYLRLRGSGISETRLYVVNRTGFDAASVNKVVLERTPPEERRLNQLPMLYGPTIEYVAPASRRIEGTVREAGTGKPVPGFIISSLSGYDDLVRAVANKDGRYKLEGAPKRNQYLLMANPPANSSWLRAGARVEGKEGLQPIAVDFTVARGILVCGRILDRATGKGVRSHFRFVPLSQNTLAGKPGYDAYKYGEFWTIASDADGRFQLTVVPGPGVLMAQAGGQSETANGGLKLNPYKQGEFDAKDREHVKVTKSDDGNRHFTAIDSRIEFLNNQSAVKYLDLAADAGTAQCDLFVERGATRIIRIEYMDDKPLKGTTVAGVTAMWPITFTIKDADCTVFALDPNKPRRLFFLHAPRKLAGSLLVRGDEKEPLVVRLTPTGAVMGRLLERDGQPLVGANVSLGWHNQTGNDLYRVAQQQATIRTGKDGRFRIEGIVPEVKFRLGIRQGRTYFLGEPRIGARQVKAGETLDLGDIRVKPGP